jgi:acyl-CoA synthetase (AMP-forming)/AMP-acid ligase II
VAGRKLNPHEVEARLAEFPGVKQAVVFGVQSALRGEEPVACIAGEDLARDAILRFCQEKLSSWQVPRDVWLVNEIPTNERGKVSRRSLAESYRAQRTTAS